MIIGWYCRHQHHQHHCLKNVFYDIAKQRFGYFCVIVYSGSDFVAIVSILDIMLFGSVN